VLFGLSVQWNTCFYMFDFICITWYFWPDVFSNKWWWWWCVRCIKFCVCVCVCLKRRCSVTTTTWWYTLYVTAAYPRGFSEDYVVPTNSRCSPRLEAFVSDSSPMTSSQTAASSPTSSSPVSIIFTHFVREFHLLPECTDKRGKIWRKLYYPVQNRRSSSSSSSNN